MNGASEPAFVVNAAVAEDVEVLGGVVFRGLGISERSQHRNAVHGLLLEAIHLLRLRNVGGFEDRRRHVDEVVELAADFALGLDALGPGHGHAAA